MAGLERRLGRLERHSSSRSEEATLREFLKDLTDEELERLETTLESEGDAWPGEEAGRSAHDLKEILVKEAEHEERVRASAEESRRRDRELVAHNRALAGLPLPENDE
jgi:hypothetical protein